MVLESWHEMEWHPTLWCHENHSRANADLQPTSERVCLYSLPRFLGIVKVWLISQ
jgi:hypothetical protein